MGEGDRERWDARYREPSELGRPPSPFLVGLEHLLPCRGCAIDVAGGTGRNALWLARRGLAVTLADVSGVALEIAGERARAAGLTLRTIPVDLETGPFPAGPWDLIVCVDFLCRPLFATFASSLAPGGRLAVAHPTRSNLQRHEKPGLRFLLEDGELPGLVAGREIEIVWYEEGWTSEGRHEARLVARRRD